MTLDNLPAIGSTVYTIENDSIRERTVRSIENGAGQNYDPTRDAGDCHLLLKPKNQCFCYFDPCQAFATTAEAKRRLAIIYTLRAESLLAEANRLARESAIEAIEAA